MKNIKSIMILLTLIVGLTGCQEFADEITEANFPRPFSPTGIEADLSNLDDVTLTWNQVKNAKSYSLELYQNDSLEFNTDNLALTLSEILPEDMPVHFPDLEKNVKYSVKVKAIKKDDTESKWEEYYFLTKAKEVKITEWNFSTGNLLAKAEELGNNTTFAEEMTIDGLTLHVKNSTMRFVQFDAPEVDGYKFEWYLDLQGGGSAASVAEGDKNRCVSFEVTEPCIITVYANSTAGRTIEAYTSKEEVIGTTLVNNKAEPASKMSINWTGGKERIYVRSQGSGINIYLVRVAIGEVYVPNTVSDLTRLTVSEGTMTPAFSGTTYEYTVNVPYSTQSVTFTPTLGHAKQTINSDLTVTLTGEETEHSIEVTAEDGTTVSVYTFKIVRETAKSTDATLKTLTITGGGSFDPAFDPEVTSYVYTVENNIESVTLSGTATHPYAIVGGSGNVYDNLAVGNNGPYNITVIAEDNSVVKTYSITVKRKAADTPITDKDWNFSEEPFGTVIEYDTEITLDELTLIPAADKTVKFTTNTNSIDGFDFTHRLQFQGTGVRPRMR
jgi:hypothetical protein